DKLTNLTLIKNYQQKLNFIDFGHINTISPAYFSQKIKPIYQRERLFTPDADFIDIDWVNRSNHDAPLVVIFHGIEGNSQSQYCRRLMYYLESIGWSGAVINYRGCSGEINIKPKFYHFGDTADMEWILKYLRKTRTSKIYAVGFSLGVHALLKLLGENPEQKLVNAAVALSVPFNIQKSISYIDNGFNTIYRMTILKTLMPKIKLYLKQISSNYVYEDNIKSFEQFTRSYFLLFYNYKDINDYYQQTKYKKFLHKIAIPTLILQARNDPLIQVQDWPHKHELSATTKLHSTKEGGHCGFIYYNQNLNSSLLKMPKLVVNFFSKY
ncbi:MAG: alpha/beta fold hydrolase, partial [Burkholderiales bacterium]|nr:alpha/beta fold hydrolase [Burkholderiales bacterium]